MTDTDPHSAPLPPLAWNLEQRREEIHGLLTEAFAKGHLTEDELDQRLDLLVDAREEAHLTRLVQDLPGVKVDTPDQLPIPVTPPDEPSTAMIRRPAGSRSLVSILGDVDQHLILGSRPSFSTVAVLGDMTLTFQAGDLPPGGTTIVQLNVFLGDIKLRVPADVLVINDAVCILGEIGTSKKSTPPAADEARHTILLKGFVLLGEVRLKYLDP